MKWIFEKLEKYSTQLLRAFLDGVKVLGSPTEFFHELSENNSSSSIRLAQFIVILSLALVAVETPLMIGVGVAATDLVFVGLQIFITLILFFLYSLCFHAFVALSVGGSFYLSTYKVVAYSSTWFLLSYFPLYLVQLSRFQAMSESSNIIDLGYYVDFRSTLDNSHNLTTMNFVGFLFNVLFVFWVYKGVQIVHGLSKLKSISTSLIGYALMSLCLHYIQNPITHHLISTFKINA